MLGQQRSQDFAIKGGTAGGRTCSLVYFVQAAFRSIVSIGMLLSVPPGWEIAYCVMCAGFALSWRTPDKNCISAKVCNDTVTMITSFFPSGVTFWQILEAISRVH
jgi:hypothetical protein